MYQARGRAYVTLGQFTLATHWTRGFIFATLPAPDDVTSTDYAAALLERGRAKAAAEQLPFTDDSFDVVLAVFGVMFTLNQEQAAREVLREMFNSDDL